MTRTAALPLSTDDHNALHAAGLAGRPVLALPCSDVGTTLVAEASVEDMLDVWQRARAAVARTRRWPVLLSPWTPHGAWQDGLLGNDPFTRWAFQEVDEANREASAVLARAATVDVDARLAEREEWNGAYWRNDIAGAVECQRSRTLRDFGVAPEEADIMAAVAGLRDPMAAADRFLFDWERTRGLKRDGDRTHMQWFDPAPMPVVVALLPVTYPWEVYACVGCLEEAKAYGHDLLVAVARRWHECWEAEPVALWGTMIQMVVARPPSDLEDAWRVAREQDLLAGDTIARPGVSLREHAHALVGSDRWFLHSRP